MPASLAAGTRLIQVTGVRSLSRTGYTQVTIETTGAFEFKADRLGNPPRVLFDILGAEPSAEYRRSGKQPINGSLLRQFRIGELSPGVTRVVFDLDGAISYNVMPPVAPNRLVIEFRPAAADPVRTIFRQPDIRLLTPPALLAEHVNSPLRGLISELSRQPPPANPPTAAADTKALPMAASSAHGGATASLTRALGLRVSTIVIDAGHGGHDQGTVGRRGVREKDVVLSVALRVGELLRTRTSAEVILTRSTDDFVSLDDRTALANSRNADLFVSIHANSSPSQSVAGTETYILNLTTSPESLAMAARENSGSEKSVSELPGLIESIARNDKITESQAFAQTIENALFAEASKSNPSVRNRGVRRAPFVVLTHAAMPAVLAEIGYLSNPREEASLATPQYREKIADSIARGVSDYLQSLSNFEYPKTSEASVKTLNPPSKYAFRKSSQAQVAVSVSRSNQIPGPAAPLSFEWEGVEWRVPDLECTPLDKALQKVPQGYELAGDDELLQLSKALRSSAGKSLRVAMPLMRMNNSTVWSSRRQSIADRWYVVRLADGEVTSQVPDSCAYVLARQAPKSE